jgi:hypothetical protein
MIDSNTSEVLLKIQNIGKQLPFALSKAINSTAEKIRTNTLQGAKAVLNIRGSWSNPRTKFGFNVKPSTKANLTAEIYTKADWMVMQEDGGIKTAKGLIAVPTSEVRRSKKDIITKGNRPKMAKGAFKVTMKDGKQFIAKRAGKGKNKRLVVLYWLEKQANIKGVYKFHDIGMKTFKDNIEADMHSAIDYAMSTAR